jgi:predicted NUDIX family phosphoesterase
VKICCIDSAKLPAAWAGKSGSFADDFFSCFSASDIRWVERPDAETNNAYKQIIPYVVVRQNSGLILCYLRQGSETRLHGLYSCGIGGHIDIEDAKDTFEKTVMAGMMRELREELVDFDISKMQISYKGIINDTQTTVGQVHLGLVFLASCQDGFGPGPSPQAAEAELAGMEWKTLEEARALKKESWSDLALDLIN